MSKLSRLQPARLAPTADRLVKPEQRDLERERIKPWRAWYRTKRWQDLRRQVYAEVGGVCEQTGVLLIGRHPEPDSPVVDHKRPHRGDPDLFWDRSNLQLVSKQWHDREKQRQEAAGTYT